MAIRYNETTGNFEDDDSYNYRRRSYGNRNKSYGGNNRQNYYQNSNPNGGAFRSAEWHDGSSSCVVTYRNGRRQRIPINYPHCVCGENDMFFVIVGLNNIDIGPKPRTFIGPYADWVRVRGGNNQMDRNNPHVIAKISLNDISGYYFN